MTSSFTVGDRLEVYLDRTTTGSGYRRYTVTKVGRKLVTLLYLPTLSTVDLDIRELGDNPSLRHVESNPRTLKRLIKATLAERRKLGLRSAEKVAKSVLASL